MQNNAKLKILAPPILPVAEPCLFLDSVTVARRLVFLTRAGRAEEAAALRRACDAVSRAIEQQGFPDIPGVGLVFN